MRQYEPYIPQTIGELHDLLGSMMLGAPTFIDKTGFFASQNIDTEFAALTQGLAAVRPKLGEDRYLRMVAIAGQMRALFEADPEKTNGGTKAGRALIYVMED